MCGTTAGTAPLLTDYIYQHRPATFIPSSVYPDILFFSRHGSFILLLSTIHPIGTGGHRNPNRGTLLRETDHQYITVGFPFRFPYFPLVTLYLFVRDFFVSLHFRFISCSSFFWEWPSLKKQVRGDSPFIVALADSRDRIVVERSHSKKWVANERETEKGARTTSCRFNRISCCSWINSRAT